MKLKQMWMTQSTASNRYALHMLAGIVMITVFAVLLACGGGVLLFWITDGSKPVLLIFCCGVTALAVGLSIKLGKRTARDATVFFLAEENQLYVADARILYNYGHSLVSYIGGVLKTEKFLQKMAEHPFVPIGANEVLQVERIHEARGHYVVHCIVRTPRHCRARCTYFVDKDVSEVDRLLYELEDRQKHPFGVEYTEPQRPVAVLIGLVFLGGLIAVCIGSHPAVGSLPQVIYFPSLAAAFVVLCTLIYLWVWHR